MAIEFNPMRSFIYVDVINEEYRHKLHYWLYYHHIPESIAQFEPYCSKYAFYDALPVPQDGDRFGTIRMQLTEHHWLYEEVFPYFAESACCTRILTSKVMQDVNNCPMHRVVEMWFTGPTAWHHLAVETANKIKAPSWAKEGDVFPYLKAGFEIRGVFVLDYATCDCLHHYKGYVTRR